MASNGYENAPLDTTEGLAEEITEEFTGEDAPELNGGVPKPGIGAAGDKTVGEFESIAFDRGPTAGFCLECRKLVERQKDGTCPKGHIAENIIGSVPVKKGQELPQLASFNWGAFFMPMVWGPVHGMWVGLLMFPLWMFVDSVIMSAVDRGGWLWAGAAVVTGLTVLMMWWFARTAAIPAYLRLKRPVSIEQFNKNQKMWAIVGLLFFIVVMALATYYNLAVKLPSMQP